MNNPKAKNTICLWFNKDAQDTARFYAATFPNSEITAIHKPVRIIAHLPQ